MSGSKFYILKRFEPFSLEENEQPFLKFPYLKTSYKYMSRVVAGEHLYHCQLYKLISKC